MKNKISPYNLSTTKRIFDFAFSLFGIILLSPFLLLIGLCILITSGTPVLFVQKRVGLGGKIFKIYKFRTMKTGSEKKQNRYKKLNVADGPVFKIFNDPRFTKIGKFLSTYGLDELPQLMNVLKNDMSIVGPRPLPVNEAEKLSEYQRVRQLVKPGITSLWVINGSHRLSFNEWMALDKKYVSYSSFGGDVSIIIKTILLLLRI